LTSGYFLHPYLSTSRNEYELGVSVGVVLVWAEQGIGDEIMFGTMLEEFGRLSGCGLLVQADRRLLPLLRRSLPQYEYVERGEVVSEDRYGSHIPMGSLGGLLRGSWESFEGKSGAYLKTDARRTRRIREELQRGCTDQLVGVSWRSANPDTGAQRSMSLEELVRGLWRPGVRLVNLQYGDVSEEIEQVRARLGVEVHCYEGVDNREDMDGLASLLEACDEVVTVGNATAHLAGAIGKEASVLLPHVAGWRWMAEGPTTPWYSSLTLLRRQLGQDWLQVLSHRKSRR
jgi:hypothetical protein